VRATQVARTTHDVGATSPPRRVIARGIGVKLDTVPASQRTIPLDRVYIVRHMNIGTSAQATITVSNTTTSAHKISLYAAAAYVRKGLFTFANGTQPNDLTTWTRLSTNKLTLRPDTETPVQVSINVPRTASQGERYAVVWAATTSPHGQVTEVNRVGIRMYIDVGPGGPPAPSFSIMAMAGARSPAGRPMVVAQVRNTGGGALSLTGTLRLQDGPGGTSVGPVPVSQDITLTSGTTGTVPVMMATRVPRGPWRAVLTLRADLLQHTGHQEITFPAPASGGTGWLLPAGIAAAVVLLALAAVLVIRSRGRGRSRGVRRRA